METWLINLSLELWQKIALAMFLGLLLGLEREHSHLEKDDIHFAGIRTFPLITLLDVQLHLCLPMISNGLLPLAMLVLRIFATTGA